MSKYHYNQSEKYGFVGKIICKHCWRTYVMRESARTKDLGSNIGVAQDLEQDGINRWDRMIANTRSGPTEIYRSAPLLKLETIL